MLRAAQRNLGNFRGFYSENCKSHKKSRSNRGGDTVGPSSNRWNLESLAKSKNVAREW